MLSLLCAPAAANPLDAFGFGARSVSMGSAATAVAEDYAANYYNPAGLAAGGDLSLTLGYVLARPQLELNGRDNEVDDSRGFQGGVVLAGQLFERGVGFSLGLHLPDERISRIRALPQSQPRWVLYDNRPQRIVISSSAAVELLDSLYFGAGLTYLANTSGTLEMRGKVHLSDAERTELTSAVDVDLASVRYWTVGTRYDVSDHWRVGVTWRQAFSLRLDIDVDVRGKLLVGEQDNVVPGDASLVLNTSSDTLYSPEQVFLGVAWARLGWLVAVDLGWVRWSAFPAPTAAVEIELDVLGNSVPAPDPPVAPEFHDIVVPRVGVEYAVLDAAYVAVLVRAGYFYEASPAPDQPGVTNYIDADKHALSAGFGVRLTDPSGVFPKPIEVDVAGQLVHVVERVYEKDDPADPVGDYTASGRVLTLAATLGFRF